MCEESLKIKGVHHQHHIRVDGSRSREASKEASKVVLEEGGGKGAGEIAESCGGGEGGKGEVWSGNFATTLFFAVVICFHC